MYGNSNNYYAPYDMRYYGNNIPQVQTQQPISQPAQQVTTQNTYSGLPWVQGEAAAKAYPVAQNSSVLLMDSETEVFYIKSTDISGMPLPLRIFDYKERVNTPTTVPAENNVPQTSENKVQYATMEALQALQSDFEVLSAKFDSINKQPIIRKEVAENE